MITEVAAWFGGVHTRRLSVVGGGIPIALLHGFADTADTWRGVLTEFEMAGRAAFAADMPGFGDADAPATGPIMPREGVVTVLPQLRSPDFHRQRERNDK